jgi:hypothetical protein
MALLSPTGEYLKVTTVNLDTMDVTYVIYMNEKHRQDGDSRYLRSRIGSYNGSLVERAVMNAADAGKTISNNMKSAAYLALKSDEGLSFKDWTDC